MKVLSRGTKHMPMGTNYTDKSKKHFGGGVQFTQPATCDTASGCWSYRFTKVL